MSPLTWTWPDSRLPSRTGRRSKLSPPTWTKTTGWPASSTMALSGTVTASIAAAAKMRSETAWPMASRRSGLPSS